MDELHSKIEKKALIFMSHNQLNILFDVHQAPNERKSENSNVKSHTSLLFLSVGKLTTHNG